MAYTERPRNPDYGQYPGATEFLGAPPNTFWNSGTGQWEKNQGDTFKTESGASTATLPASTANAFDPSKVPAGVPLDWAKSFISSNPNDYHRLRDAYASEAAPKDSGGRREETTPPQLPIPPPAPSPMTTWTGIPAPLPAPAIAPYVPQVDPEAVERTRRFNELIFQQMEAQRTREEAAAAAEAQRRERADALFSVLQQRAAQSLAVNPEDMIIRSQVDPFRAEQTRALRNLITEAAESGRPLGPAAKALAGERAGQASGSMQAQLMARELESRRSEIASALTSMGGILSEDQRANLQRELANIENAIQIQQLGISQQDLDLRRLLGLEDLGLRRQLGLEDLGLRRELGQGDIGLRRELGQAGIGLDRDRMRLQNEQFYADQALQKRQQDLETDRYLASLGLTAAERAALRDATMSGRVRG